MVVDLSMSLRLKAKTESGTPLLAIRLELITKRQQGKLSRDTDVDHKDNGGRKGHDSQSNLQAMSHSKNVGKENKRRAKKKPAAKK